MKNNTIPIYAMTVVRCFADPLPTGLILGSVRDEYGSIHSCLFKSLHCIGDTISVTEGRRVAFKECRIVRGEDGVYHIV